MHSRKPIFLADVKMNHVRGSGAGAQIRASNSQSDPVSVGKVHDLNKLLFILRAILFILLEIDGT